MSDTGTLTGDETYVKPSKRGGFQPGNKLGAKGRPPAGQGLKDRLAWWLESKTIGQINKLIDDTTKWDKLIAADAQICRVVSEGAKKSGLPYVQFIWERLLGKPPQAITGEDGKPLIPVIDQYEYARRAAFLLAAAAALPAALPITLDAEPVPVAQDIPESK